MLKKIFGEKNSIQRALIIGFLIAISTVIIVTIVGTIIFIEPSVDKNNLIKIENQEELDAIFDIIQMCLGLAIINTIIASLIMMKVYIEKLLKPIREMNEATKKVAKGDYDIVLETKRKDEIGELTENFNKMIKGLKSTEDVQNEFINNVSHEIKTPISSIEGFAKLIKDKDLTDEEKKDYANIIIEEADRLSNLTGKLLRLSKLNNQERIINKQEFMVSEQIRKAISLLEPKWSEKNLKFNVCLEEKKFYGDEELIFQVWMNLIENAIKFSNQDGKIDIKLEEKEDKIVVSIKDYGKGMADDELDKIFERFYQIDKSHSQEGFGLGLSIVKRIIELSNGEIEIKSKLGKGTKVIVKLPIEKLKDNKIYIN